MNNIMILYTTIDSYEKATVLAKKTIEYNYAACVNIIPGATSVYRWESKIEQSLECLMLFKTTSELLPTLHKWLSTAHPYTTPAILYGKCKASTEFVAFIKKNSNQALL